MMNLSNIRHGVVAIALSLASVAASADYFDGDHALLCTVQTHHICRLQACDQAPPDGEVAELKHIVLDFERRRIRAPRDESGAGPESGIDQVVRLDNRLFVSGHSESEAAGEDARSWSIAIAYPTGMMTMTVAAEEVALALFGACVPID